MKFAIIPYQNNRIFAGMYDADEKSTPMEWMLIEYINLVDTSVEPDFKGIDYRTDFDIYIKSLVQAIRSGMSNIASIEAKRVLAYTGTLNPATALSYIRTNRFIFSFKSGSNVVDKYFFEADTDEEAMLLFEVMDKH